MRKVLIVEDDKFLSAIFALFIKDMGHELAGRCQSGPEALEKCNEVRPDVVLMDIHLEGEMDGIQTAERIQRDLEIPVIFVSSDTSSTVVERAIVSNSYGYLVKPVQKKELAISIDLAYYKHKAVLDQKRREESFRRFLSEAPVPIMILQEGRIQYLNMEALDLFHTHYIEDMIGLPFLDFVEASSREELGAFLNNDEGLGKIKQHMNGIRVTGLHGKPLDVAVSGSWVTFNGKKAMQLILNDITVEKSALRDSKALRQALFNGGKGVMIIDNALNIAGVTAGFRSCIGLEGELPGLKDLDMDEMVIQKMLECEEEISESFIIQYKQKSYKCTATIIGRKGFDDREVIVRLD
ncbi:ATP-binding response regulator [Geofilum rubicundum]|uniref:Sensory transduction regulatory protein n=1 Tax=Geofilum rubicundum JCM 15548 TaxID=1236989 RepID=A0A0E9LZI8_9BACT|nr:response regulator [Geofilum rubicundum]GAO30977.1 sensory transduction regulatory protein [Geofilum rubicundum JCM 15548]